MTDIENRVSALEAAQQYVSDEWRYPCEVVFRRVGLWVGAPAKGSHS